MRYQQTLQYLFAQLPMYHRVGASAYKANLDNTVALCRMLGDPQNAFRSVHVTGTNGKGSVSHMLASIFQTAGLRTGLYTSPHLKDFRERIRVDGKMIAHKDVTSFVEKHSVAFEQIKPSFFEWTVGLAFDHFRRAKVDIAIIEVGLGGRLDSTNVITPDLSVITNVSFDHMQFLGDTLGSIAIEKAGIIKPGVPVVIGETHPETRAVFIEKAAVSRSPVLFADTKYLAFRHDSHDPSHKTQAFDIFRDRELFIPNLVVPLPGLYQGKNVTTVMGACEILNSCGYQLSHEVIRKGLRHVVRNTGFAGRWQILGRDPLIVCDTGHNVGGIAEVVYQLEKIRYRQLHFIMGVVNDKDLAPVMELLPKSACYYFCKPDIPRGLDASILRDRAMDAGLRGDAHSSVQAALIAARKHAQPDDMIFIGGSNFVVAEVI